MWVIPESRESKATDSDFDGTVFGDGDFLCNRKLCSITTKSTKSWIMLDKKEGGIPWQNFITIR